MTNMRNMKCYSLVGVDKSMDTEDFCHLCLTLIL